MFLIRANNGKGVATVAMPSRALLSALVGVEHGERNWGIPGQSADVMKATVAVTEQHGFLLLALSL